MSRNRPQHTQTDRAVSNDETIALRATVIGGERYDDDYTVIWRGLSIGRIMKGSGAPSHFPQWSWNCYVPNSGNGKRTRRLDVLILGRKL